MPKISREMSALEVSRLKNEGAYAVGGVPGLYLQILGGSRAWVLRFVLPERRLRRRMGLGAYPAVTLAQARERAREAHTLVDQGIDPIQARRDVVRQAARKKSISFKDACAEYIAAREDEWKNSKHRQQWENTLATYAAPVLGQMLVSEIETPHIIKVLDGIWRKKTETAVRVRGRIEQVLDWAKVYHYRDGENPARWRGHLDHLLPSPAKIAKVRHHPAVPVADAPAVIVRILAAPGTAAKALRFQILTAARSGEVRGATWAEMDLEQRLWTIPAARMKAGRIHRVPLSRQAIELLKSMPSIEDCDYIFPSMKYTMLSDMALTAVMRRLKLEAVPHGWRSTFRDWASETTNYPNELLEMALAHAIEDKTEAAYRRGDLLAKRASLMQEWADYCLPISVAGG